MTATGPAEQLDLFDDPTKRDEERAQRDTERAWYASPQLCPCCGSREPNGWLLRNNHGINPDGTLCGFPIGQHPNYQAHCIAQSLVSIHIYYAVTRGLDPARDIARGRTLGLDVEKIIAESLGETA